MVGLNWDPFADPLQPEPKFMWLGWTETPSWFPFNQNQHLCGWVELRSFRRSPSTRTKICVVGLNWDHFVDPLQLEPTSVWLGWIEIPSPIPFNQNQNLCGWAELRPLRQSPSTKTKICVVGLNWDPFADPLQPEPKSVWLGWTETPSWIPFNQNQHLCGWAELRSLRRSPSTRTKILSN